MSDKRRSNNDPHDTTPPPDWREDPDWFETIGPDDDDRTIVEENLNEYGWNQMDETNFESDPVGPADMPDWTRNAVYGEGQPLIPEDDEVTKDFEDLLEELDAMDDEIEDDER